MTGPGPRPRPHAALLRAIGDRAAAPDRAWVAALSGRTIASVDRAIRAAARHREALARMRAVHRAAGRSFYAQIRAPLELYALVRLLRPRHIVEAGVSSGVSSAMFLAGLRDNRFGRLHSIDLPTPQKGPTLAPGESPVAVPPGRSSGWAVPSAWRRRWDLRIGPSERLLPALVDALPGIDLFLHDDRHTPAHLAFELATVLPRLGEGAVVLADNTQWTGAAFERFAARIGAPPRFRRGTDLVGLRVPAPAAPGRGGRGRRAASHPL